MINENPPGVRLSEHSLDVSFAMPGSSVPILASMAISYKRYLNYSI